MAAITACVSGASSSGVAGDEIVIVERMHERSFDIRKGALVERLPRHLIGNEHQLRAERAHAFHLGGGRGLDRDDGAGHARLARRIGDALAGVAGADRPYAALALGFAQHRHRIGRTAQLVGIDRLQILELQTNVGETFAELEANERCSQDRALDPRSCLSDL
jgi:hypothetical protein